MYLATLEDGNPHENLFERHDEVTRIKHDLFDHTDEGSVSTHSILLDGSANRKIGLAKSLMVKPGDVIDLEVYAKYFDSDAGGLAAVLNTLASNLASSASGVVIDGVNAGNSPLPFADFFSGDKTSSSAPEAYLNYFVFDQNYDFISSQSGFKQVGTSARETGSDVDHQKLSHSITIEKAGFVYIYLSNDDTDPFDVFFDDFKVTQHHTDIVSKDDYYPFGMSFASYSRPAGTAQNFKYNGNEVQEETGWYDFYKRTYDPTIGRFLQVDPYADLMQEQWTPYHNSANNPVNWSDPDGDFCVPCVIVGIIGYVTASLPANAPSTDEDANDEAMKKANDAYGSQVIGTTMIVAGMAMDYANSPDETPANPDGNDNPYDENGPTKENAQELENQKEAPVTDEIYKRPNNATNPKQRKSVQGKPCVTCGADDGQKNVADHKKELVKEHYETGTIDKDRMKSEDAVQPQCEDCSRKQGGEMSGYSKKMKKIIKERTQ